jgi:prepilin-type N-terminal cleavage/methylation domain-containing protein/prepilin-type processing-associated H-X9-DG protein
MRKKGFTLIELLVVIAIIALLLSIVVPAMGKAKDYAKRVICGNNLKQNGIGVNIYAQNNNGKIMENWRVPSATTTPPTTMPDPHNSYRAYSPANLRADGTMKPYHLAVLYDEGEIDDPRIFYCPAQQRDVDYAIRYYYDFYTGEGNPAHYGASTPPGSYQWGTKAPVDTRGGQGLVRTSYNYWTYGQKLLQKIPGYKPFIFDNIQEWEVVPHRKSRNTDGNPQGLSALFADGHVAFCNDPEIWDDTSSWPWNKDSRAIGDGPGNDIARFEEVLRRMHGN